MNPETYEEAEALEEAEARFRQSLESMTSEPADDRCQWERAWQSVDAAGVIRRNRPPVVWDAFLASMAAPRPTGAKRPRDEAAAADGAPANARRRKAYTSKYVGVYYVRGPPNRWRASYRDARGKLMHVRGYFDDEEAAARAYNAAVQKAGLRRKMNREVNGQLQAKPERSSSYFGVSWNEGQKQWVASVTRFKKCGLDGKKQFVGLFDDEIDAAKAVDTYLREHMPTIAAGEHRRTFFSRKARGRPTAQVK